VKLRSLILVLVLAFGSATSSHAQEDISPHQVRSVAWSPDGSQLAVGYENGQIIITSSNSEEKPIILHADSSRIITLAWSPDGHLLASGSLYPDSALRLWDTTTGEEIATYDDFGFDVFAIGWSPDGTHVLAIAAEGISGDNAVLLDVSTGQITSKLLGAVSHVQWSPNGSKIALANIFGLSVRNATDLQPIFSTSISREPFRPELVNQLVNITWSPDGQYIAGGMGDGRVFVWRLDDPDPIITLIAHDYEGDDRFLGRVHALRFDESGEQLTAISGDGTIWTWSLSNGRMVSEQRTSPNYAAAFSLYGGQVALGIALDAADEGNHIQSNMAQVVENLANDGVQIIVPDASPERLQAIAEACGVTLPTESRADLTAQLDRLEIPPVCRADLLAVAAALD
jgi:WD40 repeat protein